MATNDKSQRYDWHKDRPAVKLTALFIDRAFTTVERVLVAIAAAGTVGYVVVKHIL
jgi:hypothetical protein